MKRLLVIGGTRFVGRAMVEEALSRGWDVTVFHRGQTNDHLFEGRVTTVHGDRLHDLGLIQGEFDACIDSCGYFPRAIWIAADALSDRVGHMTFVSTISVYADPPPGSDELAALGTLEDKTVEEITGETYGGLKVLCEEAVKQAFGEKSFLPRPGLIIGPEDYTDRWTYWIWKIATQAETLVPNVPEGQIQLIDARDLAKFVIHGIDQGYSGPYNCVGPATPHRFLDVLEETRRELNPSGKITLVDPAELEAAGKSDDAAFPLYGFVQLPGWSSISAAKARAAGLQLRPLLESARDTVDWMRTRDKKELAVGLSPEDERALLDQLQPSS